MSNKVIIADDEPLFLGELERSLVEAKIDFELLGKARNGAELFKLYEANPTVDWIFR